MSTPGSGIIWPLKAGQVVVQVRDEGTGRQQETMVALRVVIRDHDDRLAIRRVSDSVLEGVTWPNDHFSSSDDTPAAADGVVGDGHFSVRRIQYGFHAVGVVIAQVLEAHPQGTVIPIARLGVPGQQVRGGMRSRVVRVRAHQDLIAVVVAIQVTVRNDPHQHGCVGRCQGILESIGITQTIRKVEVPPGSAGQGMLAEDEAVRSRRDSLRPGRSAVGTFAAGSGVKMDNRFPWSSSVTLK